MLNKNKKTKKDDDYKKRNDQEEIRIKAAKNQRRIEKEKEEKRKRKMEGYQNMPASLEEADESTKQYLKEVYKKAKKDKGAYGLADTLINKKKIYESDKKKSKEKTKTKTKTKTLINKVK
jgi:hypothetical protein